MGQSSSTKASTESDAGDSCVEKWPVVYGDGYNFKLMGFEKMGKFDLSKCERVKKMLVQRKIILARGFVEAHEATDEELRSIHSEEYLASLKEKATIKSITGISALSIVPYSVIEKSILRPFRMQASGTVLAGKLAIDHGWAINLGGGQHHCSSTHATPGGFSAYADVTMNIKHVLNNFPAIEKVLIIDLDVHQGNGYAHDFMDDDLVFIFDIYNSEIFPHDEKAKKAIKCKVELQNGVSDEEYLGHVKKHIDAVLDEYQPHYVLYNAGVDILKGDPIGFLSVSPEGVIERDKLVFSAVRSRNIPIAMLLSGGLSRNAALTVADSITNLHNLGLIKGPKSNITN